MIRSCRNHPWRWRILKSQVRWEEWYIQIRSYLKCIGAWEYVDADADPVPEEPTKPLTAAKFHEARNGLLNSGPEGHDLWELALMRWKFTCEVYNSFQEERGLAWRYFSATVPLVLAIHSEAKTMRDMSLAIRKYLEPREARYRRALASRRCRASATEGDHSIKCRIMSTLLSTSPSSCPILQSCET